MEDPRLRAEHLGVVVIEVATRIVSLPHHAEIEGGEEHIHRTAAALGKTPEDYITDSYRTLFVEHCQKHGLRGTDMLFDAVAAVAGAGAPAAE